MSAHGMLRFAFPVDDTGAARCFYTGLLGCPKGRSTPDWFDLDFFCGHQIVAHLWPGECGHRHASALDGDQLPARHFGAILPMADRENMAAKRKAAGKRFAIEAQVRFNGQLGEQATMFLHATCRQPARVQGFRRRRAIVRQIGAHIPLVRSPASVQTTSRCGDR